MKTTQDTTTLACPTCGQQWTATVWLVLDRQERPDLIQALLDGTLNVMRCPHCGAEGGINQPLLLHDGERQQLWCALPLSIEGPTAARAVVGELHGRLLAAIPPRERQPYLAEVEIVPELDGLRSLLIEQKLAENTSLEQQLVALAITELLNISEQREFERLIAEQRSVLLSDQSFAVLDQIRERAVSSADHDLERRASEAQAILQRLRTTWEQRRTLLHRLLDDLTPLEPHELAVVPQVRNMLAALDPQEVYQARIAVEPAQRTAIDGLVVRLIAKAEAEQASAAVQFLQHVAALPQQ